jgi:hypothetical protein
VYVIGKFGIQSKNSREREIPLHSIKPYFLVVACLLLGGALSIKASPRQGSAPPASASAEPAPLDYEFFKTNVEPIFVRKRPGHARCFLCHGDPRMRVMALVPLPHGVTEWTDEQSRKNFESVKEVAIPGDLQSPLLRHPLATDAGGDLAHTGGKHFQSQSDPEWLTLKAFIMGETVKK